MSKPPNQEKVPPRKPSLKRGTKERKRATKEKQKGAPETMRMQFKEDIQNTMNYGTSLPIERIVDEAVREKEPEEVTLDQVTEAIGNGDWNLALKQLFYMIFGKESAMEGLGFLVENVDAIPVHMKAGVIAQAERADQTKLGATDKIKLSMIRTTMEQSLWKAGYAPGERASRAVERYAVTEGQTLENILRQRGKADIWYEIEQQTVLGVITENNLPENSYLYFDKKGYPIFISAEELELSDVPPRTIFRKRPGASEAAESEKSTLERQVEFLERNLQQGDILLVSQGGTGEAWYHEVFEWLIRKVTSPEEHDNFPHIHVMTYLGGGNLAHITMSQGGHSETLREAFIDKDYYSAISVARFRSEELAQAFAHNTENIYPQMTYAFEKLVGMPALREGVGTCVDIAAYSAEGIEGLEKIHNAQTALDIADSKAVDLIYSLELPRQVGAA